MIKLTDLSVEFSQKKILDKINWFISPTDKVGLIGANGSGKSVLMKVLVKEEKYDEGSIYIAPKTTITYLSQELPEFKNRTLLDEAKSAFPEVFGIQFQLNEVEEKMQVETDEKKLASLIDKYSTLLEEVSMINSDSLEREIFRVLKGLGFKEENFDSPVGSFSGGWQMRIALAKLLLQKPNLLLLDEPTNHLDLEAVEWLEKHIKEYEGAVVLISHDRRFLDNIVNKITEIENTILTDYPGNYSDYEIIKERNLETIISAHERQEKEIKKMQAFVDRFKASAHRSTQAKSREKMIEKIERIEVPKGELNIDFEFPPPPPSGRTVITLKDLSKTYDGRKIFSIKDDIIVERGDKIAILGLNGAGKSTLMKILIGEEQATTGSVEFGHNVNVGYFAQNQSEKLDMENSIIDEIHNMVPDWTLTRVRFLLARFLFRNDIVFQPVRILSGGERSRLAMAKMLLTPTNLILMDEPTNHLDLPSKEVLINALIEFPETFVVISHDRDFISRTCNRIFEIKDNKINIYEGSYDYYLEKKNS
ncbi:MAG: ABC-F family ATP-binding cassette domain-containing protein [Candidatus Sericytochromatia bacterium]